MTDVWVVIGRDADGSGMLVNGVFWTREAALAICDENCAAAKITMDRDYTNVFNFTMATKSRPEPFEVT